MHSDVLKKYCALELLIINNYLLTSLVEHLEQRLIEMEVIKQLTNQTMVLNDADQDSSYNNNKLIKKKVRIPTND